MDNIKSVIFEDKLSSLLSCHLILAYLQILFDIFSNSPLFKYIKSRTTRRNKLFSNNLIELLWLESIDIHKLQFQLQVIFLYKLSSFFLPETYFFHQFHLSPSKEPLKFYIIIDLLYYKVGVRE